MLFRNCFALLLLSANGLAAPSQDGKTPFIVNGMPANFGDFPYIVALTDNGALFCGGSLLNARTVLTAAHCFDRHPNAGTISIRAGSLQRSSGGTSAPAAQMIPHPDYKKGDPFFENDIAILKLSSDIAAGGNIAFATLVDKGNDPDSGRPAMIAGWGLTSINGGSAPENLNKAQYSVVGRAFCMGRWPAKVITDNKFCTQGDQRASCSGDSGGPVVVDGKLAGVISINNQNCDSTTQPDIDTRIGNYRDFIDQHS